MLQGALRRYSLLCALPLFRIFLPCVFWKGLLYLSTVGYIESRFNTENVM